MKCELCSVFFIYSILCLAKVQAAGCDSCQSGWDGSIYMFKKEVKRQLVDPDSFQRIKTYVGRAKDGDGFDCVSRMEFRSKNGFGGYVKQGTVAAYNINNCLAVTVLTIGKLGLIL